MLQVAEQQKMSEFENLYERLIPKNHMLRRMNDLMDYGFVREELREKYCPNNGRNAVDPAQMFKYLLLKAMFNLSDRDLVEHCMYDMSYKYFLGLRPEDDVIDSSSLTKFRKLRLTDENILDMLIGKSVKIAIERGIIKSKTIIVDATHTKSRYNQKSAYEVLLEQAKQLRKAVYRIDEGKKANFPTKITSGILEDAMDYCRKLTAVVQRDETLLFYPPIAEKGQQVRGMKPGEYRAAERGESWKFALMNAIDDALRYSTDNPKPFHWLFALGFFVDKAKD